MKQVLLFALSFVVLTMLGTWLWMAGGDRLYAQALRPVALEIYGLTGVTGRGTLVRTRFINLVPFTALMLVAPGLAMRKRIVGLLIGWCLLALSHVALNGYAMTLGARGHLPRFAAQASDAMPFLLWLFLARDSVRALLRRSGGSGESDADAARSEA
ncbi:MAG TPA: hypothetical protein VKA74_16365 [Myxococcota bacterium]|nr:hypothetical protein [Myxococcota bacterium]